MDSPLFFLSRPGDPGTQAWSDLNKRSKLVVSYFPDRNAVEKGTFGTLSSTDENLETPGFSLKTQDMSIRCPAFPMETFDARRCDTHSAVDL